MASFTIDRFAEGCKKAMGEADDRRWAARAYLEQTLERNTAEDIVEVLDAAVPDDADIGEMIVHTSPELTMLYARVPPRFQSAIHNHTLFACIGQLFGTEIGIGYARDGDGLRKVLETRVGPGQVVSMPADAIHQIENPGDETASALHIYGGDFTAVMSERSLWTADGHEERPFSFPELLAESARTMKSNGNHAGLDALVAAIPTVKPIVDAL